MFLEAYSAVLGFQLPYTILQISDHIIPYRSWNGLMNFLHLPPGNLDASDGGSEKVTPLRYG